MTPLKTLMLRVDLFAGTTVGDAAQELCLLAERVGALCVAALCVADFNGVKLWARPGDDPLLLAASYDREIQRPATIYRIAQAREA